MNVLVCDDHPIVAAALATTIESLFSASVHVVHTFTRAREVAAGEPSIELCLIDIHIPGEDARTNLTDIRSLLPHTPILVFSGSDDDADLRMALELGLHGFLPKSSAPEVVEAAVRLVLAGGRYLPERAAALLLSSAADPAAAASSHNGAGPDAHRPAASHLTPRQHIVLGLLAEGRSNKAIARELGISPATVKAHVAQVIGVLGASNRTEAVARARELKLL